MNNRQLSHSFVASVFALLAWVPIANAESLFTVSETLPSYEPVKLDKVELSSVGSDSMGGLVDVWVRGYRTFQPSVTIEVVSESSAMGAAALIEGTADMGPMAREMKGSEIEEFKSKYGFEPTQVKTAIAAVGVYVSADNPLTELTLEQLDALFSDTRKRGALTSIKNWSQLGIKRGSGTGEEAIALYGSEFNSSLSTYFKQQVLMQGNFVTGITSTTDVQSLLSLVASNPSAIGFGEVVENPKNVKLVAIKRTASEPAVKPSLETLAAEQYPLGRFLNVYVVREPGKALEPATMDFLRFVLSQQGQQIVLKEGFIPLPASVVAQEFKKL